MIYEKAVAEIVKFDDFAEFMTDSPGHGHTCGTYIKGQSCSSWTTTAFGGGSCNSYNGKECYGYSDSTHDWCDEYGISCGSF